MIRPALTLGCALILGGCVTSSSPRPSASRANAKLSLEDDPYQPATRFEYRVVHTSPWQGGGSAAESAAAAFNVLGERGWRVVSCGEGMFECLMMRERPVEHARPSSGPAAAPAGEPNQPASNPPR